MTTRPESITPEQESVLGSVPEEWEVVQLEGLGHWGGGKTPRKSTQEYWNGETLWVSPKDMDGSVVQRTEDHVTQVAISEKNLTVYDPGSVMVVFRSGVLRHTFPVATCNRPFAVNQDMKVLTPGRRVNNEFAFYLIDHLGPVVLQKATKVGTTVESVDTDSFMSLSVGLPPLSEQRRIADVLDTVDTAIRETDAVVEKQEQVKTGLLQDLLTRGLNAEGRLRDPEREAEAFRKTELGTLPVEWEVVDLEEITKRITDGSHQAVDTLPEGSDGIPFLYVSCIRNGEIHWDQASRITRDTFESISKGKEPKPGVILYTTVGSYGHAALVEKQVDFSFQRHVGYIDPDADMISPGFLAYWLDSQYCKRHANKIALGSSQKTVTLRDLARYPVPLPSYEEQKMIAERLDESDSSIQGDKAYKNKLQSLKKGLMQDLLTGRVRVSEAEARVDEVVA